MPAEYVINLEKVKIEKNHPYTIVFEGYVPMLSANKLYTFKYDGDISYTDAYMSDKVKESFGKQLFKDYNSGIKFNVKEVREKMKKKSQYRIKM